MRDYGDIARRIEALGDRAQTRLLGEAGGYPIHGVSWGDEGQPLVWLTGGVHGDEPAGVEAVLRFLERDAWPEGLAFAVVPCVNPHGWVHNQRENAQGCDINWSYARDDVVEVQVVKDMARGRCFEFVVDFHEDWESPGFYIYEIRRNGVPIAQDIARQVAEICPLNGSAEIEGQPARGGVVYPDITEEEATRGRGIPLELFRHHTDHLLTTETPTGLDMETRVATHLAVLDAVVAEHRR